MAFLRRRPTDRGWRLSLGLLWLPAIVVVLTIADWLHLSQSISWILLGVLLVAFLTFSFIVDRFLR